MFLLKVTAVQRFLHNLSWSVSVPWGLEQAKETLRKCSCLPVVTFSCNGHAFLGTTATAVYSKSGTDEAVLVNSGFEITPLEPSS
jgi:hypothetical protein